MLRQRGDTIIEVLLAITVFSLVSVGTMTIMNQGTNSAQRSLEMTLVKEQIESQAEALRAAQQDCATNKIACAKDALANPHEFTWNDVKSLGTGTPDKTCPTNLSSTQLFAMNGKTASYVVHGASLKDINTSDAPPYAQVRYENDPNNNEDTSESTVDKVYGLWIEKTMASGVGVARAYDFTIRACWYSVGTDVPMQLQTVVRLYDPAF